MARHEPNVLVATHQQFVLSATQHWLFVGMVILHDASVIAHGFILLYHALNREISMSITHRAIAWCVRQTPRDFAVCSGHNWVISWCVHHTLGDFALCWSQPGYLVVCPSHTARFRGVLVTTGLSRGPSHTARCHGVSVTPRDNPVVTDIARSHSASQI